MATEAQRAGIEARCRFVFNHVGGRFGLTTDAAVAADARAFFMTALGYTRAPGLVEYEISLQHPEPIDGIPENRGFRLMTAVGSS